MTGSHAEGAEAVLVSGHALATEAGLEVLREGGNAIDAGLCAALALLVVTPHACTLAGDAFMLVTDPSGCVHGLNGSGAAPASIQFSPGEAPARRGARAATVPGLLAAIADAASRFGTMPIERLLDPAIALAENGFAVYPYLTRNIKERSELLRDDPIARTLFLPDDAPLAPGVMLHQPELAAVLKTLRRNGLDDFYQGEVARQFSAAVTRAGGWISETDLAQHRSLWQRPISVPFYGHDVLTMPPNSYGATLLLQLLALERGAINAIDPDADAPAFIQRGYRARQASYGLLADVIGDPKECDDLARARVDYAASGGEARAQPFREAQDRCTTNVVAMDRAGWSLSLIESISTPFGAGIVLEEMGIVLNNRLAGFSADPASRNALRPGKRPAHTLAPCLVLRDGRAVMSLGTPGTVGQTCVLAQTLARLLASKQRPQDAIAAPRWSADLDGTLIVEETMKPEIVDALSADGASVRTKKEGFVSFGSLKLAMTDEQGFSGFADHRRSAAAGAL